ncbi:hypothetical protein AAFF_G00427810 [Aldrovandia affinis]|uniref:Uncharacterized protein n=1 Tax=Aldrovandia affinis TaxID=143900 RepID=A0AAD7SBX6_9TELE|nr:hypothetical protein AAFF_G00427810 [Aldrovandia affinis]
MASHTSCAVQWSIEGVVMCILHDGEMTSLLPVKAATMDSLTTATCPRSLKYHVDCPDTKYVKDLECSCPTFSGTTTEHQHYMSTVGKTIIGDQFVWQSP